jgi:hypothetical protein
VSDPSPPPTPYRVSYSARVQQEILRLGDLASERGQGAEYLAAVKEIDRRLRIYPQFGEPLLNLTHEPGQVWIGTVAPLVLRYAIYEERRLVVVSALPVLLPLPGS